MKPTIARTTTTIMTPTHMPASKIVPIASHADTDNASTNTASSRKNIPELEFMSYLSSIAVSPHGAYPGAFNAAPKPGTGAPIPSVDIVAKWITPSPVNPRGEEQEVHRDGGCPIEPFAVPTVHGLGNSLSWPLVGR